MRDVNTKRVNGIRRILSFRLFLPLRNINRLTRLGIHKIYFSFH